MCKLQSILIFSVLVLLIGVPHNGPKTADAFVIGLIKETFKALNEVVKFCNGVKDLVTSNDFYYKEGLKMINEVSEKIDDLSYQVSF